MREVGFNKAVDIIESLIGPDTGLTSADISAAAYLARYKNEIRNHGLMREVSQNEAKKEMKNENEIAFFMMKNGFVVMAVVDSWEYKNLNQAQCAQRIDLTKYLAKSFQ